MTSDGEDRSTWPRNGQVIRREELLRLIEDNGGAEGLDLRGAEFVGEGKENISSFNPIDLRAGAVGPEAAAYRKAHNGLDPPWLDGSAVLLQGAQLDGASLERAQLQGAILLDVQLQGASLQGAQFQEAILWDAQLQGASLQGAQFQGAGLVHAQLQGAALESAQLQGAVLPGAELQGADLRGAQFQGASLVEAQLQGGDLRWAQLQEVDMYDIASLDGARWYGSLLDHTRIKRDSLGKAIGDEIQAHKENALEHYHRAKEAYLLLKNNFNQIGRYEDSSWAYVKEQQMEKMAFHWEWRWQVWRAWGSFGRWLRNWAYELVTGYGERPWNAVLCGLAAVLAFAVGFWATGCVGGRGAGAFFDSLVYSISAFATFNLARPGLNPEGRGVEIASSLEAILGIAVLALVVFTVGNRMSRG